MIVLLLVVVVIRFSAHLLGKKTREERDQLTAEGESKDDSDRPPHYTALCQRMLIFTFKGCALVLLVSETVRALLLDSLSMTADNSDN